jgi:exodeoxyribonuclease V alpha subunit
LVDAAEDLLNSVSGQHAPSLGPAAQFACILAQRRKKPTAVSPPGLPEIMDNRTETLSAQVRKIVFRNDENGYVVATVQFERGRTGTIVGALPDLAPGETIRAEGRWETDPRHGPQFRVLAYTPVDPETTGAMIRYLGSGLIKGIGPAMATAMVKKFGLRTFDVIDRQPRRLRDVPGIGRAKAAAIEKAWQSIRHAREIGMLLQQAGAPRSLAPRILQVLGDRALDLVRRDPYRLVGAVRGIGFNTADRLAHLVGIGREDPRRLSAGLVQALEAAMEDGHTAVLVGEAVAAAAQLLSVSVELIDPHVERLIAEGRVGRETLNGEPVLTPPAAAAAEKHLARALAALADARSRFRRIKENEAIAWVQDRMHLDLEANQRRAVLAAIHHRVTVITGGPGTGKTTIVRAMCEIAEALGKTIALAAPTGRAAKRLAEATGRPAKTVHRLLEVNPRAGGFDRHAGLPLDADLVICDEASMLDVFLAMSLADAVPPGAHFVLVGDVDQLPSVGPGNVLADMIDVPWIKTERLTQVFRQAAHSRIITNAHRIRQGEMPELAGGKDNDFFFLEADDPEKLADLAIDLVARRLPQAYGFDPWQDIMVLAPMHRGEVGVARLNERLREQLNPTGDALTVGERLFRLGDKVMQTANNYDYDIYNGDLGRIVGVHPDSRELVVEFENRRLTLGGEELFDLMPAYAISVHKSQGSEYPCVVAPLHTQHYIMLARNLLYTAVTRGKRLVVLCGSRRALERAVQNDTALRRKTMLRAWLLDPRVVGARSRPQV